MTETGVEAEFALEEPSLRYHRLGNDLSESCARTEITTVAAHWKVSYKFPKMFTHFPLPLVHRLGPQGWNCKYL